MDEISLGSRSDPNNLEPVEKRNLPRFGISLLWLLLFAFVYFFGAMLYFFVVGVVVGLQNVELAGSPEKMQAIIEPYLKSPSGIAGMYLVQFCLLMPALLLASNFSAQPWRETLSLKPVALKSLGFWLLVLTGYLLAQTVINGIFGISPTEFLKSVSGSKNLWLVLVMITLAPVLEELLFRGYLFKAWRYSRLGLTGTLLLTSALFVGFHWGQYHWMLLAFLFMFSVILGLSREKTGSVWAPVILHGVNNFLSGIFVVYLGIL